MAFSFKLTILMLLKYLIYAFGVTATFNPLFLLTCTEVLVLNGSHVSGILYIIILLLVMPSTPEFV